MKNLTTPNLEPQALLLAGRLRKVIQNALTVQGDNNFMWTNNSTVLRWLHSLEKQPVFLPKCVVEILELMTVDEFTVYLSANSRRNSLWLDGPSFLRSHEWLLKPPKKSQTLSIGNKKLWNL